MEGVLDLQVATHGLHGARGIEGSGGDVVARFAVRLFTLFGYRYGPPLIRRSAGQLLENLFDGGRKSDLNAERRHAAEHRARPSCPRRWS